MKAIMISIRPQWVAKILNGEKTIEIRKTCPEIFKHLKPYEGCSIDVYIYCTKDKNQLVRCQEKVWGYYKHTKGALKSYFNGKVVAKFTLNKVEEIHSYLEPEQWYKTNDTSGSDLMKKSCLTFSRLDNYLMSGWGYAWHINNLEIFDKPKELSEFRKIGFNIWCKDALGETIKECEDIYLIKKPPQSWFYIEV